MLALQVTHIGIHEERLTSVKHLVKHMELDKAVSRVQDVITTCKYLKHSNNSAGEKS